MRYIVTVSTLLSLCGISSGANSCKKDACYNNVAVKANDSPNLARRKADCSSILQSVVVDATTTVIRLFTAPSSVIVTVSVTDSTEIQTTTQTQVVTTTTTELAKRMIREPETQNLHADNIIEVRDKIVIKGTKPAYARSCNSNQDYAVACLCFGVKGNQQSTATQTITTISTVSKTVTSTLFFTSSSSTTTTTTTTSVSFSR